MKKNDAKLLEAARDGYFEETRKLLKPSFLGLVKAADINARYQGAVWDGFMAIHFAAEQGHDIIVRLLLDKGVPVNARTAEGYTPLICAAAKGHFGIVKDLIRKGANVHAKTRFKYTALHSAAFGDFDDIVQFLLQNKAEVNARASFARTPLHEAARAGAQNAVRVLLENGADVNALATDSTNENGSRTPLKVAALYCNTEVMGLLMNAGAQFDLEPQGVRALGQLNSTPSRRFQILKDPGRFPGLGL